jgi:hypothetical protein
MRRRQCDEPKDVLWQKCGKFLTSLRTFIYYEKVLLWQNIDLEILMDLLGGFYLYAVFKSTFIIGHFLVNMNTLAPNTVALQMAPTQKNGKFVDSGQHLCLNSSKTSGKY